AAVSQSSTMLCWMTGTGIVTVTGVGAGVGVAVGVAVGVGVAVAVDVAVAVGAAVAVPPLGEGDVSRALAAVRLSAAAARATPPAARNCRLVATTDRMGHHHGRRDLSNR